MRSLDCMHESFHFFSHSFLYFKKTTNKQTKKENKKQFTLTWRILSGGKKNKTKDYWTKTGRITLSDQKCKEIFLKRDRCHK